MNAFTGHPCPAPELPLADIGPLRSATDIALDLAIAGELLPIKAAEMGRIADEWRKRWGRNQEAYFEGRRG